MSAMIKAEKLNIIFEKIEQVRKSCNGKLHLPQICVVGDQSTGKSTLLTAITGVELPESAGICTKVPLVVRLVKSNVEVTKVMDVEIDSEHTVEMIKNAQDSILAENPGLKVVNKPVDIVIMGKDLVPLTIVDLPGIIHHGDGKEVIQDIIESYIKGKHTIICLCRNSTADQETVSALNYVDKYDPNRTRTIEILTRCDVTVSHETTMKTLQFVQTELDNEKGPHMVAAKINGKETTDDQELQFFKRSPYSELVSSGRLTVKELRETRLTNLLINSIVMNTDNILGDIAKRDTEAHVVLEKLGSVQKSSQQVLQKVMQDIRLLIKENTDFISEEFYELKFKVKDIRNGIDAEDAEKYYVKNPWAPAFYNGGDAFNNWVGDVCDEIYKETLESINRIPDKFKGVIDKLLKSEEYSYSMLSFLSIEWNTVIGHCVDSLICHSKREVDAMRKWNITNHYVFSLYNEEADYLGPLDTLIEKYRDPIALAEIKSVRDECGALVKKDTHMDIDEKQKGNLCRAVRAYCKATSKTFSDKYLHTLRLCLFEKLESWIDGMPFDEKFIKVCQEPDSVMKMRNDATKTKTAMKKCRTLLSEITAEFI